MELKYISFQKRSWIKAKIKRFHFFILLTHFLCYNEIIGIIAEGQMGHMSTNLLIILGVIFLTTVAITILIKIPEEE